MELSLNNSSVKTESLPSKIENTEQDIKNHNESNFLLDFTFHKNMYKVPKKCEVDLYQKEAENCNSRVRRVEQEYPKHYERIRNNAHPRVNLPVFRTNRNEKIKVFSVKGKDRNQKWKNIEK